jgi:hypothetical protein
VHFYQRFVEYAYESVDYSRDLRVLFEESLIACRSVEERIEVFDLIDFLLAVLISAVQIDDIVMLS